MTNFMPLKTISIFTFLGVFLLNTISFSQEKNIKFENYSLNEGLSQSTIYSILQDSKGFIWIGTRTGGLNKFDGYNFKVYKNDRENPNSISGNAILNIYEDSNGYLWLGTRTGLNKFDPKTEKFTQYYSIDGDESSISDNVINDVYEDEKGKIWVATKIGLCLYNSENDRFKRIKNDANSLEYGYISKIIRAGKDQILFGTKLGVILLNTRTNKILKTYSHLSDQNNSLSGDNVTAMIIDSKGRLWVGTRKNGLNMSQGFLSNTFTHYTNDPNNPNSIANNIIRTLHEDQLGNIWVGTKSGLSMLTVEEQDKLAPKFVHFKNDVNNDNSLRNNSIYAFTEDSRGNFWIGTWNGGLDNLNIGFVKFQHYKHQVNSSNTLSNNVVSSFSDDGNGNIWVGTEGGGLNLLNRTTNQFNHFKHNLDDTTTLNSDHVKALFIDKDGDLWVGTFNGLHLYDKYTKSFHRYLEGYTIYSIEAGIDDYIWVGTSSIAIKLKKSDKSYKTYDYDETNPNSISNPTVNMILKDNKNGVWIGTKDGLNYYNRETDNFTRYYYSKDDIKSLSNSFVASICEDKKGTLWFGTPNGLNKYNPDKDNFTLYNEKNGFPDDVINSIIADNIGNLWLTTNRGLTMFNPETGEVKNYNKEDGLQDNEFVRNSVYKSETGELYFGGLNGFNVFDPENIKDNTLPPQVIITEFRIFNKEVKISDKNSPIDQHISYIKRIKLSHKQSVISFSYVGINYLSPNKNQYTYMMEGFDKDWIDAGNKREASYTNLPAGEYTFRVKASNNDGYWNEEGTSIEIKVRPPWWKTWAFYIIVIILLSAIIYYFIKAREAQLKSDRKRLEKELEEGKKEINLKEQKVKETEIELKAKEEDEKITKWHNTGFINISNLISEKRHNIQELANSVIFELVDFLEVQMGAIYFSDNTEDAKSLTMMGGYALDSRRLKNKTIQVGEGMVGTCFKNNETVNVNNLATDYAKLDSGLGGTSMSNLLLIPIIYEETNVGVIELISLTEIADYKIKLVESVCKSLGAAIINEKANQKIKEVLEEANQQKETLASHEEELRQNIEELAATQEESAKREEELLKREKEHLKEIETLKNK